MSGIMEKTQSFAITGHTRMGCLLGSPVRHSLSPVMYNDSFRTLGLDCVYLCFEIGPTSLGETVRVLRDMEVYGFNLTMPNKTAVIPFLDALSEEAKLTGAVNTVKNTDGKLTGYNTDGMGYIQSLRKEGITVEGMEMTLLGAGGAAGAIAVQAALEGAGRIHLVSRKGKSWAHARELTDTINEKTACRADLTELSDEKLVMGHLESSRVLTNATNAGMGAQTGVMPLPEGIVLPEGLIVSDIIYEPRETRLLKEAKKRGLKTMNGLKMLLYQGEAAFRIWTGRQMPVEMILKKYFEDPETKTDPGDH